MFDREILPKYAKVWTILSFPTRQYSKPAGFGGNLMRLDQGSQCQSLVRANHVEAEMRPQALRKIHPFSTIILYTVYYIIYIYLEKLQ